MKYFIITIILLLSACSNEVPDTKGPIQGQEVNLSAQAYEEMCEREPTSPLCNAENQ